MAENQFTQLEQEKQHFNRKVIEIKDGLKNEKERVSYIFQNQNIFQFVHAEA